MTEIKALIACIVTAIIFIGFFALVAYGLQSQAEKDTQKYNNGIHADCGGHWILSGVTNNYMYYQCDKCHEVFKRVPEY